MQGNFVWYELMTTDTKAAQAFYADVVGWKAQDAGDAGHGLHAVLRGRATWRPG